MAARSRVLRTSAMCQWPFPFPGLENQLPPLILFSSALKSAAASRCVMGGRLHSWVMNRYLLQ